MFMSNKKWMEEHIAEIQKWATESIPEFVKKNPDPKTYFQEARLVINLLVIESLIGAEISKDTGKNAKSDYKIKFNKAIPTATQLAEITTIMDKFVTEVEDPYLSQFADNDDDMGIPKKDRIRLEKLNAKSMRELILEGGDPLTNRMINAIDCVQLAAIGADLRNKTIRDRILIVGGIALVVTGAGVVGYTMYKKHKEENDNEETEAPVVDIDSGDMPTVDMDDSAGDAPVVEID